MENTIDLTPWNWSRMIKKTPLLFFFLLLLPGLISSQPTQVLFSPHDGIRDRIIKQCNLTQTSIDVAIFMAKVEFEWSLDTKGKK